MPEIIIAHELDTHDVPILIVTKVTQTPDGPVTDIIYEAQGTNGICKLYAWDELPRGK